MLYVVRHAKSSWEDPGQDDFDRPLNDRGTRDAHRMGKRLKERHVMPVTIYSSPALRALTTANTIAHILDCPTESIRSERKLYHASEETILEVIRSTPDKSDCIMIVGHNPGLTGFVNELLHEDIDNIPTTGAVGARLEIESWKASEWKCGVLLFFDYPKRLA